MLDIKRMSSAWAGKWADFIIVDGDFFEIPEQDIWKMKVLATFQAGETILSLSNKSKNRVRVPHMGVCMLFYCSFFIEGKISRQIRFQWADVRTH